MFANLKLPKFRAGSGTVRSKLLLLIVTQSLVLILVGGATIAIVDDFISRERVYQRELVETDRIVQINETLRVDIIDSVNALQVGAMHWDEAARNIETGRARFEQLWKRFTAEVGSSNRPLVKTNIQPFLEDLRSALGSIQTIVERRSRSELELFISNDLRPLTEPFIHSLLGLLFYQNYQLNVSTDVSLARHENYQTYATYGILLGILLAMGLGFYIYRSLSKPVASVARTLSALQDGDLDARSRLTGDDEISSLGSALDNLLDERVTQLANAQRENEALNNAVVGLLRAVYQLSQRDLTVKVPVTEDVTGPIADSLNLLTEETSSVLNEVVMISHEVSQASSAVKQQSDRAMRASTLEQAQASAAAGDLAASAEAILKIARLAQTSSQAAEQAIKSTEQAQEIVLASVEGITGIRETIRETEKRIKRLGERSQEISVAVSLINNIAERTHILALNASMHAASAGEAGRGFAVVADEVQRLAENARQATSEIAGLVNNIQIETADTASTMNNAISQVVEGTSLAERAGEQMQTTNKRTAALVSIVMQIAKQSREHARANAELRSRARDIQQFSAETNKTLKTQTEHTARLIDFSERLVDAVGVFKLPSTSYSSTFVEYDKGDAMQEPSERPESSSTSPATVRLAAAG